MSSCVLSTSEEQREMLREIGFDSFETLLSHIPQDVRVKSGLKLPRELGEVEVVDKIKKIAQQNVVSKYIFRGAGAYNHYMPAIAKGVISKGEFLISYTPYQAEIGQGILQSIFKCQTMLCEFTGMDVSNAPVYDGVTAATEVAAMCRDKKRSRVYLSATTHPQVIEVVKIYRFRGGTQVVMVPEKDGVASTDVSRELLDDMVSYFYAQQPNYCGNLEECDLLGEITYEKGAKYIMGCSPISLALLPTPAECGADVTVGDGQPPGMPLCFGDPYLSFTTATSAIGRKLPGRIVGETRDVGGKRMYVLTLRVRGQHIGRERASSSVCPNQTLCALTTNVYMAAMGGEGLRKIAVLCTPKAHYPKEQLEQASLTAKYDREFFHEFVTEGGTNNGLVLRTLEKKGILGGLPLNDREILWCTTEQSRKKGIDQTTQTVKKVRGG